MASRGLKISSSSAFSRKKDSQSSLFLNIQSRSVVLLSEELVQTYRKCNPDFRPPKKKLQRILTNPSKCVGNNGLDNEEGNLVCRVHDVFESSSTKYTVLDFLGTGTFGQVFRCRKEDTNELVAVKIIKNKTAYRNQGLLEAKIAKLLNKNFDPNDSRHIVRLLDEFEFKNHLFLVFELLSISLFDVLTQNQYRGLSLQTVQRIARQVISSLVTFQDASVIHCDLKPENILIVPREVGDRSSRATSRSIYSLDQYDPDSVRSPGDKTRQCFTDIKVIDLGSACFEGKTMYSYIQSRFYRAPEVLLGVPYNGAIDMWSFACVCMELYLGLPLFPGVSQHNQLTRIIEMFGPPIDALVEEGKNWEKYFVRIEKFCSLKESFGQKIIHGDNENDDDDGSSNIHALFSPSNRSTHLSDAAKSCSKADEAHKYQRFRLKTMEEYAKDTCTEIPSLKKYLRYTQLEDIVLKCPLQNKNKLTHEQKIDELQRRKCFLDFLLGLFRLNPFERWTAKQAASHPFITNAPFEGPFEPPPDPKVNERKLSYLIQTRNYQYMQLHSLFQSNHGPSASANWKIRDHFETYSNMSDDSDHSYSYYSKAMDDNNLSSSVIDHNGFQFTMISAENRRLSEPVSCRNGGTESSNDLVALGQDPKPNLRARPHDSSTKIATNSSPSDRQFDKFSRPSLKRGEAVLPLREDLSTELKKPIMKDDKEDVIEGSMSPLTEREVIKVSIHDTEEDSDQSPNDDLDKQIYGIADISIVPSGQPLHPSTNAVTSFSDYSGHQTQSNEFNNGEQSGQMQYSASLAPPMLTEIGGYASSSSSTRSLATDDIPSFDSAGSMNNYLSSRMTDFGQALLRPEMDERRRFRSMNKWNSKQLSSQQFPSFLLGKSQCYPSSSSNSNPNCSPLPNVSSASSCQSMNVGGGGAGDSPLRLAAQASSLLLGRRYMPSSMDPSTSSFELANRNRSARLKSEINNSFLSSSDCSNSDCNSDCFAGWSYDNRDENMNKLSSSFIKNSDFGMSSSSSLLHSSSLSSSSSSTAMEESSADWDPFFGSIEMENRVDTYSTSTLPSSHTTSSSSNSNSNVNAPLSSSYFSTNYGIKSSFPGSNEFSGATSTSGHSNFVSSTLSSGFLEKSNFIQGKDHFRNETFNNHEISTHENESTSSYNHDRTVSDDIDIQDYL